MGAGRIADLARATAGGNRVGIDPALGNLRELRLVHDGRTLSPLHVAPWLDEPEVQDDATLLPVERALAGDFFCAPFGASDIEDAPAHGWPANSAWTVCEAADGRLRLTLDRAVMGARIEKRLRLSGDAPLLYQEHLVRGGEGGLTVAHHPMVRLAGGGRFCTSPKRGALTPDMPLEPARHALACPARSDDLTAFPAAGGETIDLTRLPIATAHEDFVTLVEAEGAPIGWSAVLRDEEDDIVFVLKDPAVLPVTMLWHSNGGRDHAPWNGRHRGVLGIEDGCAAGAAGHRAALADNPVRALGVPTALPLAPDRVHRVAHVIGAIARPPGWTAVTGIRVARGTLRIEGDGDAALALPFDAGFFDRRGGDGDG